MFYFPYQQSHGGASKPLLLVVWICGLRLPERDRSAARTGTWSSRVGLKGLIRKFIILLVAIGFHGVDQIFNEPWIGAWAIGALSLNELISILENVEKAGFGQIIPQRVRDMLETVQTEHEKRIKEKVHLGESQNE